LSLNALLGIAGSDRAFIHADHNVLIIVLFWLMEHSLIGCQWTPLEIEE
jgi:hypothetical protein